jgi:rRNA maturation protein Nop10
MSMNATDHHTDGNAIAGLLQEIFVAEFTTLERTCQSCGDRNPAGAHRSYRGAGVVLRCPHCGDVALKLAALPDRFVFELRGTWSRATGA